MTNKEYLSTLSDRACAEKIMWLLFQYSIGYTSSLLAIQDWLGKEHVDENNT